MASGEASNQPGRPRPILYSVIGGVIVLIIGPIVVVILNLIVEGIVIDPLARLIAPRVIEMAFDGFSSESESNLVVVHHTDHVSLDGRIDAIEEDKDPPTSLNRSGLQAELVATEREEEKGLLILDGDSPGVWGTSGTDALIQFVMEAVLPNVF